MIIRPIQNVDYVQKAKERIFTVCFQLQQALESSQNVFTFLYNILAFIPTVSIFFKYQNFLPIYINKFFQIFLISTMTNYIHANPILINSIIVCYLFLIVLLAFLQVRSGQRSSLRLKVLFILLNFFIVMVVPFTQNFLSLAQQPNISTVQLILNIFMGVLLSMCILFSLFFIKFSIMPFRKKVHNWNYQNQRYFYSFVLNVLRVFVFCVCYYSLKLVIISLVAEFYLRNMTEIYKSNLWKIQINTVSNFVIGTHMALLCLSILQNQIHAGKILILIYLLIIIQVAQQYANQYTNQLEFPKCGSDKFMFYDFYFKLKEKYFQNSSESTKNMSSWANILKSHCLNCKLSTCPLKNKNLDKDQLLKFMQIYVTNVLALDNKSNAQHQILYQLWKMQIGKKFNLKKSQKDIKITNQYIILSIQFYNLSQLQVQINQNSTTMTNSFYQHLNQILTEISKFYDQFLKAKPRIQIIINIGDKIRHKIQRIKQMYAQVLKNKAIDFKAIQIFLQFQNCFLNEDLINFDLLRKITQIQRNTISEDIQEIYLPTMTLYPETGLIQNVNVQCLSFLQYSRFQLKTKNANDLFVPHLSIQKAKSKCNQNNEGFFVFIQKGTKQLVCCKIQVNEKFMKSKKLDVIVFQKQKIYETNNFILVDIEFQLIKSLKQFLRVKGKNINVQKQQMITQLSWDKIYNDCIKPNHKDLLSTKILKTYIKESNSMMICNLLASISDGYFVIAVKIMKDTKFKLDRRSVLLPQQGGRQNDNANTKFEFYHTTDPNQSYSLVGMMKNLSQFKKPVQYSNSLNLFSVHLRSQLVKQALITNKKLDKSIKTYRLHQKQLYNIDLEDKQAYVDQFQTQKQVKQHQNKSFGFQNQFFILAGVFLLVLGLTVVSLFLLISTSNNINNIQILLQNNGQIDRFLLDYNRILASYRDVATDLYAKNGRDWHYDIYASYNHIQQNKNQKLFSNKQLNMTLGQSKYTGNLNQLIQIILSQVFSLIQFLIPQRIEWIHTAAILQAADYIKAQKKNLSDQISLQFDNLIATRNNCFAVMLIGTVMFYFLTVFQYFKLMDQYFFTLFCINKKYLIDVSIQIHYFTFFANELQLIYQ